MGNNVTAEWADTVKAIHHEYIKPSSILPILTVQARFRALEGRFSSHPRCSRRTFASREFTSSSSACSPASIATISAAITAAAVCHAPTTTHPLATTQGQVLAALAAFNVSIYIFVVSQPSLRQDYTLAELRPLLEAHASSGLQSVRVD